VDLIFTDVVMPKLHGPAMVMKLRQEGVGCGVLYATGYSQQAITRLGMEAANGPVMLKPYTQQTLLSKVREVMEAAVPEADIPEG
jgi:FixJ family two-component response regulator